jgi:hypothetical protein
VGPIPDPPQQQQPVVARRGMRTPTYYVPDYGTGTVLQTQGQKRETSG